MNFHFSEEEERFRSEVEAFVRDALPDWWYNQQAESPELWDFGREFAGRLAARGWLALAWPEEWGGAAASAWTQLVMHEVLATHQTPPDGMGLGIGLIGPMIMAYGTEEQQRQHLPGIASGEVVWAECFSEPNTGSDLAGLETRAVRHDGGWLLTGEKVWISHGAKSDWALVLARSDPDAERKHQGISAFLVDMSSPGIDARLLDFIVGSEYVSEVNFNEVFVPETGLLGERGRGFYYAMESVGVERAVATKYVSMKELLQRLVRYASQTQRNGRPIIDDEVISDRMVSLLTEIEVSRLMSYYATDLAQKGAMGAEASLVFAWDTQVQQRVQNLALDITGEDGRLTPECDEAPLRGLLAARDGRAVHATIAPGTLEIQKMVVATRYLGLPRS